MKKSKILPRRRHQRGTKPEEWAEYNAYCEHRRAEVSVYGEGGNM